MWLNGEFKRGGNLSGKSSSLPNQHPSFNVENAGKPSPKKFSAAELKKLSHCLTKNSPRIHKISTSRDLLCIQISLWVVREPSHPLVCSSSRRETYAPALRDEQGNATSKAHANPPFNLNPIIQSAPRRKSERTPLHSLLHLRTTPPSCLNCSTPSSAILAQLLQVLRILELSLANDTRPPSPELHSKTSRHTVTSTQTLNSDENYKGKEEPKASKNDTPSQTSLHRLPTPHNLLLPHFYHLALNPRTIHLRRLPLKLHILHIQRPTPPPEYPVQSAASRDADPQERAGRI